MNSDAEFFDKIRTHVLEHSASGGRIETETALAKKFGVSRYRIRKVLSALSQMGVLDRSPKKGSMVRKPDAEFMSDQIQFQFEVAGFDAAEFVEARVIIECAILPLAVRRLTPFLMTQLENSLRQIEANAHQPLEADKYDRDFHLLILKACGNRILEVFSGVLLTYFEKTTALVASFGPEYFLDIAKQERAILKAMKAGDVELSADLLRKHLTEKAALER